jgi:hypothetical protein
MTSQLLSAQDIEDSVTDTCLPVAFRDRSARQDARCFAIFELDTAVHDDIDHPGR